jgi:hypothetical protein
MKKKSIKLRITEKLDSIELQKSINKKELVIEIYGNDDYFIRRTFDVILCNAKKELKLKKDKIFYSYRSNEIVRLR